MVHILSMLGRLDKLVFTPTDLHDGQTEEHIILVWLDAMYSFYNIWVGYVDLTIEQASYYHSPPLAYRATFRFGALPIYCG